MRYGKLTSAALTSAVLLAACTDEHPTRSTEPEIQAGQTETSSIETLRITRDYVAPFVANQVIVRFKPTAALARGAAAQPTVAAMVAPYDAKAQTPLLLDRTWLLEVERGQEKAVVAALSRDPDVEFADLNYAYRIDPCETGQCRVPSDPFFGYKWDLHNDGSINTSMGDFVVNTGEVDADIDWLEMFNALGPKFGGSAVIGILDSGILDTHNDLRGKVIGARNFALFYPPDFTIDRDGHGTFVAGVAAAFGDNGVGVSGVGYARNIKLLNAKVCELYDFGPPEGVATSCPISSIADAIIWATDNGANVLNLSLGGLPTEVTGPAVIQAALRYARSRNVLPFCATGNNALGEDYVGGISFPARFPECVAVGATDWYDNRAGYSSFSIDVDLTAPGGDVDPGAVPFSFILSTYFLDDDSYAFGTGTSFATPQAAGLAAVLYATGITDADNIYRRMRETADDLGPDGFDDQFGFGRINACRALDPARVRIQAPPAIRTDGTGENAVPIVIYNTDRFDPTLFDLAGLDLTLGDGKGLDAGVLVVEGQVVASFVDADGDGDQDLAVAFPHSAVLQSITGGGSTIQLVVRGSVGCRRITGSQTVQLTPPLP